MVLSERKLSADWTLVRDPNTTDDVLADLVEEQSWLLNFQLVVHRNLSSETLLRLVGLNIDTKEMIALALKHPSFDNAIYSLINLNRWEMEEGILFRRNQ